MHATVVVLIVGIVTEQQELLRAIQAAYLTAMAFCRRVIAPAIASSLAITAI